MNKTLAIVLGVLGAIVALIALVVGIFFSANNRANGFETSIKAENRNSANVLTQYEQKVIEAAQVPDMKRDDLIKVAREAMTGRYGKDGSKAVFQAIREDNPAVTDALYVKLQQITESSRNELETSQRRLIDVCRAYDRALGDMPGGFFMKFMGFPRYQEKDCEPIETDRAAAVLETKREKNTIKLRQ